MNKDQAPNRSRQGDWNPALGVTLKAGIAVPKGGTLAHPARDPLVPISSLRRRNEIDEIWSIYCMRTTTTIQAVATGVCFTAGLVTACANPTTVLFQKPDGGV